MNKFPLRIGFAGIGLMGLPMCNRLLAAGHSLCVWNRNPEKTKPLLQQGAVLAATPADLAQQADIIFLCLYDADAVSEVVFGEQGLSSAAIENRVIVDHSSIAPQKTRSFAAALPKTWQWLDAPVSGGTGGAASGTLAVMVGGPRHALEQVVPFMQSYAKQITHMGDVGAGQVTKLCNQTIVTATIGAIAEAISLAQDAGVDASKLSSALAGGWADSVLLQIFVDRMHDLPIEPTATIQTMLKDLNTIAVLALEQGTAMPISHATQQIYQLTARQGLAQQDVSYLIQTLKVNYK